MNRNRNINDASCILGIMTSDHYHHPHNPQYDDVHPHWEEAEKVVQDALLASINLGQLGYFNPEIFWKLQVENKENENGNEILILSISRLLSLSSSILIKERNKE